jgi:hypothetical protein
LGATWASDASSSPGTWTSDAEEEAVEDVGSVFQDSASFDTAPATIPLAKVLTPPCGSMQRSKALLQSTEDTHDPDHLALNLHIGEPQKVFSANLSLEGKTTVMVSNVPANFVQQELMREINTAGFSGMYDFLYLPMHPKGCGNHSSAFINFTTPEAAEAFKLAFGGSRLGHFNSSQPLDIVAADLQGFEEIAAHYLGGRRVPGASHAPLFFRPLPPHLDDDYSGQLQAQQPHVAACSEDQIKQTTISLAAAIPMPIAPPAAPQRTARFCACCGARRSPDHRFCPFCGADFDH